MAFLDKPKKSEPGREREASDPRFSDAQAPASMEGNHMVDKRSPMEINMDMERTVVLEGIGGRGVREFDPSIISESAPSGMAEPDSIAIPSDVSSHAASSPSERASRVLSRRSWGAFTARGCMRV
jgi:hypothetical protein